MNKIESMEYWKNTSLVDFENETWRPILGYDGMYFISNYGRIKSIRNYKKQRKEIILKQYYKPDGYLKSALSKDSKLKTHDVHRLVAIAHVPNPENKPEVNHKKGIKTDNRSSQLEWVTSSENAHHKFNIGLQKPFWLGKTGKLHHASKKVVQYDMNMHIIKKWDSVSDINRELGFDVSGISDCCIGRGRIINGVLYKRKSAFGYKWSYE